MDKKKLILVLKVCVSVGTLAFLFHSVAVDELSNVLFSAKVDMLIIAILSVALQIIIANFRWYAVIVAIGQIISFGRCLSIYTIGLFFNQLLPSGAGGDVVRVYKAYKNGLTLQESVHSVMLERAFTMLALVIVLVLSLPRFLTDNNYGDLPIGMPIIALLVGGAVAGVLVLTQSSHLPAHLKRWKIVQLLTDLSVDSRKVFLSVGPFTKVMGWSLIAHIMIVVKLHFLALSVGVETSFIDSIIITTLTLLVLILPISIAGWGVREGAMVGAYALLGVAAENALAISILYGLVGILAAIPGAFVWLRRDKKDDVPENLEV